MRSLETVQHRQQVHGAIAAECTAMRKIKDCGSVQDERRWPIIAQAIQSADEAFSRLDALGMQERARRVGAAKKKLIGRWRTALFPRMQKVLEMQEMEKARLLYGHCRLAHFEDDPECRQMLRVAAVQLAAIDGLEAATASGRSAPISQAIQAAIDSGLTAALCDVLKQAVEANHHGRRLVRSRWLILLARMGSDKEVVKESILWARDSGMPEAALEGAKKAYADMTQALAEMVRIAHAKRDNAMGDLEQVLSEQPESRDWNLRPRSSLIGLLDECTDEAQHTLAEHQLKEELGQHIRVSMGKRNTALIEELPQHIEEARNLKMDDVAEFAEQAHRRAVAEKKLKQVMGTYQIRAMTAAIEGAMDAEADPELIASAQQELARRLPISLAAKIIDKAPDIFKLNDELAQLAKRGFPDTSGASYATPLGQVQARVSEVCEEMAKAKAQIQLPLFFESNSLSLPGPEFEKLTRAVETLRKYPYLSLRLEAHSSHTNHLTASKLSTDRCRSVIAHLKKEGLRNTMHSVGLTNWTVSSQSHQRPSVRIHCGVIRLGLDVKKELKSMLSQHSPKEGRIR
eukprot:TRINITY_DN17600_c0_g1_i1.p1 TRINITY_DN17600_c0_g1~~TRINITY_DN17600_c0_g1_i1.p1  ORF type:complete len:670 (+),score=124.82 TRINITY_DN17600_c0_g1_i1:292-2010(+)